MAAKKHASGKTAPAQKAAAATGKKQAKQPAPHKAAAPHKSPKKPKSPAAAKRSKTLRIADRRKARTKARRAAPACVLHDDGVQGHWITGGNLTGPTCVATAVANSLLVVTGYRAGDADVLELARRTGADGEGVSIEDTLAEAHRSGFAGWRPWFTQADDLEWGAIAGAGGTHAVVSAPGGLVSWGGILPDWWELDGELWLVKWRR